MPTQYLFARLQNNLTVGPAVAPLKSATLVQQQHKMKKIRNINRYRELEGEKHHLEVQQQHKNEQDPKYEQI